MRSINSSTILNPLEERILASVPLSAKHFAVIGDGDGRMARAIREKLGANARVFVVEPRVALHKYLDDFDGVGTDPWAVEVYAIEVQKYGPFDFLLFYGLHEYWRGQVRRFQQLLVFASPKATLWVTFVNSSALRYLEKLLPPLRLSADAMAAPSRFWGRIDYASWMAYAAMLNARAESVWGLFDQTSFQFCEDPAKSPTVEWDIKGAKIQARTAAEVVHWGAAYLGIQMTVQPDPASGDVTQALGGVAYNTHLFQTLIDPFPEASNDESELAWADTELRTFRASRDSLRPSPMIEFLIGLVEDADSVRDVLFLGAGWGRDVYMIKKARPQWRCIGIETSREMLLLGENFRREEDIRIEAYTIGEKLPFADKSFDVILSLGFMSRLYDQAALPVAQEILRVARKGIYHLEDGRGPEESLKLKQNTLGSLYAHFGSIVEPKPVLIKGQNSGLLFYKIAI